MKAFGSYLIALIATIVLHAGLVVAVVANWDSVETKHRIALPKYVDA